MVKMAAPNIKLVPTYKPFQTFYIQHHAVSPRELGSSFKINQHPNSINYLPNKTY